MGGTIIDIDSTNTSVGDNQKAAGQGRRRHGNRCIIVGIGGADTAVSGVNVGRGGMIIGRGGVNSNMMNGTGDTNTVMGGMNVGRVIVSPRVDRTGRKKPRPHRGSLGHAD